MKNNHHIDLTRLLKVVMGLRTRCEMYGQVAKTLEKIEKLLSIYFVIVLVVN